MNAAQIIKNNRKLVFDKLKKSEKILIFDTYCGLCNQIYDIQYGINFCLKYGIKFSFRYASFRNNDLVSWYNVKFEEIFNPSFLKQFDLYIDYETLNLTKENTYNFDDNIITDVMLNNTIGNLLTIDYKYIVLLRPYFIFQKNNIQLTTNILPMILPAPKLVTIYTNIMKKLKLRYNQYNFVHYRYEHDFRSAYKLNIISLKNVLDTIKFKDNLISTYVASTQLKELLKSNDIEHTILFKDEDKLIGLNFEQCAFIDFMIGRYAKEVYGHSRSSFSHVLNQIKGTSNFYI